MQSETQAPALSSHLNFSTNNLWVCAQATLASKQLNSEISSVYLTYITHSFHKEALNAC